MVQHSSHSAQVRRYLWRLAEVSVLLLFLAIVVVILGYAMKYILPFVIGWVIAVLLIPLVRGLELRGVRRMTAVLTVLVSTVVIAATMFLGIIAAIAREATMLSQTSTQYFREGNAWILQKIAMGRVFYGELPPQVAREMQEAIAQTLASMEIWFQDFAKYLLQAVTHLPETLFVAVIAVITTFFILLNRERMMLRVFRNLPPGWGTKLRVVLDDMTRAFVGTIRVQLILMLVSAILGVIGMWILHFPYAVLLGIVFGLFGGIPILGSALLTVPWAVGALILGDVSTAVKLIVLQLFVSLVRHLIEPKILADSVGLDTLSTLFALYVGMKAMGVFGLFLGPIILIGIKSLLRTHLFVDILPQLAEGSVDGVVEENDKD